MDDLRARKSECLSASRYSVSSLVKTVSSRSRAQRSWKRVSGDSGVEGSAR